MTPQKADMVNHENSRKHRRASGESSDDSVTFRGVADALQEYGGPGFDRILSFFDW